jgi:hypothetical protein
LFALYHCGAEDVTLGFAERRAGSEAVRCRAAGQTARIMILISPDQRGEEIVACPVEEPVITDCVELGAAFHPTDPGFAGAVVAWHPHGREQGNDLPGSEPIRE